MICGIYLGAPKSASIDKVYIGQSNDIEDRIARHNYNMRKGTHYKKVQDAYNEYGEFEWEVLEECSEESLHVKEKYYIKLFNACNNGFNTYEDSSSAPILYGVNNGNVRIEEIHLYKKILDTTIMYPSYSRDKIAELCNSRGHVVSHIWYGASCKWLGDLYPVEYAKVVALQGSRHVGGKSASMQNITYPTILDTAFAEYTVDNVRQFASDHSLDKGDLSNVLNMKVASIQGWIIKDLDVLNPIIHNKFYSSNRGRYKKQFDLYKAN